MRRGQFIKKRWRVDPITGCWEWLLSKCQGYGQTWDALVGKTRQAHVVAYEKKYGPVPKGKELDHVVCNNRGCCNPDHVKPASSAENTRRGKSAKLTFRQVREIRANSRCTQAELGKKYGITQQNVSAIVKHKTWKT